MEPPSERESVINTLPPVICANIREKVIAEEISASELIKSHKEKGKADILQPIEPIEKPVPIHKLTIAWWPQTLLFEVKEEPIVKKLWIWNSCTHCIYVQCCEIWEEKAYLGARWGCYPKTRFHLAPGLTAEVFVKASPNKISLVPCAFANLQLAAAHKRDNVTGYFAVPVNVKFLNHIPYSGEGG